MSHKFEIKEGAFVISDAHYSPDRPQLLQFIKEIHSKKLQPTQLILMGDVFDALFGSIDYTYQDNLEMIQLLEDIADGMEVIYLEGNHDFNLRKVFNNIKIYSISAQPILCRFQDKKVYLAHGDFDGDTFYKIYTAFIRNSFILFILKYIDLVLNHLIINKIEAHLDKKDDCKELTSFENYIVKRLSNRFDCDFFVEGHFHQNKSFQVDNFTYVNLGAFACNQRYFIVKSTNDKELLEEVRFFQEM